MSVPICKVLVHAANGAQGGAIVRRLREEELEVRAGVRNLVGAAPLAALGADLVAAELDDAPALRRASDGVDAVVLTLPLDWARDKVVRWAANAARAARQGGARLLVFNASTRLPVEVTTVPSFEIRREAEDVVRDLGPPTIVLRPPFYLDNLAGGWIAAAVARDRVLPYPMAPEVRAAWLSLADLGGYVAAALRRPDLAGRTFDVGGPEVLDGPALARAISAGAGQPITYVPIPPDVFERDLGRFLGPEAAAGIARSYHWIAAQPGTTLLGDTAPELAQALRRPLLTAAEWARTRAWTA